VTRLVDDAAAIQAIDRADRLAFVNAVLSVLPVIALDELLDVGFLGLVDWDITAERATGTYNDAILMDFAVIRIFEFALYAVLADASEREAEEQCESERLRTIHVATLPRCTGCAVRVARHLGHGQLPGALT